MGPFGPPPLGTVWPGIFQHRHGLEADHAARRVPGHDLHRSILAFVRLCLHPHRQVAYEANSHIVVFGTDHNLYPDPDG